MKKLYFFSLILFTILLLSSCDSNNYAETSYTYKITDEISDIDINWNIGNITITSGDSFSIEETSIEGNGIAPLKYSITDKKISIDYNDSKKELKITLDKNKTYDGINISSIDSCLYLSQITLKSFCGKIDRSTLTLLDSVITYFDVRITCQHVWNTSQITDNVFDDFNLKMERMDIILFSNNSCTRSSFDIRKCNISFSNNKSQNTTISIIFGKIELILLDDYGYNITTVASNTSIDFETISYNTNYLYKNGENKITCFNKTGDVVIKRVF